MGSHSKSSPPSEDRRRRRKDEEEDEEDEDRRERRRRGGSPDRHHHHSRREDERGGGGERRRATGGGGHHREEKRPRREDEERERSPRVKEEPRSSSSRDESRQRERAGGGGGFGGGRHSHPAEGLRGAPSSSSTQVKVERDSQQPTEEEEIKKDGPNFQVSGKLMEDTNVYNGVVIKYSEPPEARKPKKRWRLYVFKGEEAMPVLHMHRQSAYLLGKDRKIVDIPIDHPSCSRQHAVFQYRLQNGRILPYIIDLGSSNGTFLNNKRIEAQRYHELREKDMLKFGFSSREYVLLHDQSKEDDGEMMDD